MAVAIEHFHHVLPADPQEADTLLRRLAHELVIRQGISEAARAAFAATSPGCGVPSSAIEGIISAVAVGIDCLRQGNPRLDAELTMRQGPLRMQYEARGPGLIRAMQRSHPQVTVPARVIVACVPPFGHGGVAFIPGTATLLFESPLTDLTPELPEVLRLVWGLCGIGIGDGTSAVAGPAMDAERCRLIAPLLSAAQSLELARYDRATVDRALDMWLPPASGQAHPQRPAADELMADWDAEPRSP